MVVKVLFPRLVEGVFLQYSVELTDQVHFVANELELVVDNIQVALLNNELFDILRFLFKQGDTCRKPFFCLVSSFLVHIRNQFLNLVVKLFRSRLKFAFDCFRVKLQQTDISAGGQICLKVLLVVLKQLHNISEVLNRIF